MTFEQFRESLQRLNLSLADFAELVGVSARTVSRWGADSVEEIPGPVAAYLGLMLRLTPEDRAAEIGRLTNRGNGMHDGMYHLSFSGIAGIGGGGLLLQNGKLYGVDGGGVQYDGTYALSDDRQNTVLKVRVTAPPGGHLVTGARLPRGAIFDLEVTVPAFSRDATTSVATPFGRVTANLKLLRGIAAA